MENETMAGARSKITLQPGELICTNCSVQATSEANTVCQLCRALGKNVEPVSTNGIWSDIRFGGVCAKRFVFGLDA